MSHKPSTASRTINHMGDAFNASSRYYYNTLVIFSLSRTRPHLLTVPLYTRKSSKIRKKSGLSTRISCVSDVNMNMTSESSWNYDSCYATCQTYSVYQSNELTPINADHTVPSPTTSEYKNTVFTVTKYSESNQKTFSTSSKRYEAVNHRFEPK